MAKTAKRDTQEFYPMLLNAKQMSKVSGIGENTLRSLMARKELEYLEIGNHKLICVNAIWDFYNRNRTPVRDDGNRLTKLADYRGA